MTKSLIITISSDCRTSSKIYIRYNHLMTSMETNPLYCALVIFPIVSYKNVQWSLKHSYLSQYLVRAFNKMSTSF